MEMLKSRLHKISASMRVVRMEMKGRKRLPYIPRFLIHPGDLHHNPHRGTALRVHFRQLFNFAEAIPG
jgi:hypothetical protein